jgi:hypothetical protein
MTAPQIIILSLMSLNWLLTAHLHGKPKTGNYNIFITIVGNLINLAILYWGGFFA